MGNQHHSFGRFSLLGGATWAYGGNQRGIAVISVASIEQLPQRCCWLLLVAVWSPFTAHPRAGGELDDVGPEELVSAFAQVDCRLGKVG